MRNFQQFGARQRGAAQQSCHVPSGKVQAAVRIPNNQGFPPPLWHFGPPKILFNFDLCFLFYILPLFFGAQLVRSTWKHLFHTSRPLPVPPALCTECKGNKRWGRILTVGQNSACGTPHRGEFWATRKRREKYNILRQFIGRGYSGA